MTRLLGGVVLPLRTTDQAILIELRTATTLQLIFHRTHSTHKAHTRADHNGRQKDGQTVFYFIFFFNFLFCPPTRVRI